MELGLKGRAAAITGGSKGIGKAITRGLAAEGVNLVLLARGKHQLEKTADEIVKESGVEVLPITGDIANAESLKSAAAAGKDRLGAIHIMVNNAGGPMRRMDRQINWPESDWIDDVNLKMIDNAARDSGVSSPDASRRNWPNREHQRHRFDPRMGDRSDSWTQ